MKLKAILATIYLMATASAAIVNVLASGVVRHVGTCSPRLTVLQGTSTAADAYHPFKSITWTNVNNTVTAWDCQP